MSNLMQSQSNLTQSHVVAVQAKSGIKSSKRGTEERVPSNAGMDSEEGMRKKKKRRGYSGTGKGRKGGGRGHG